MVSLFPRSSDIEDILSGSDDGGNFHVRSSQPVAGKGLRGAHLESGGGLASVPVDYRDSLDLSSRELTHTRGLAQTFVAVMTLNLSKNSISIIGALPIGLRVLDISCNILLDLQGCSALKRLEKIDVSHNRIQSFAGIEGCSSLKLLYAQSNPLQIVTHIDLCPYLQLLDMSDCSISSWDGVRVLSLCKSLRQLAMKGCPVSSRPASRARVVHLVPHLTILDGVPMPNSAANPRPASPRPASPRAPPASPKHTVKGREPDANNSSALDSSRAHSATANPNIGSGKPVITRISGGSNAKGSAKGSSDGTRSKWSMEDEEEMRMRAQEQAQRWQERLDRHRVQQELNLSQNEVRIFGASALGKGSKSPEASPHRRPLSPAKQALKAKMLSQGLSVVDVNFIDSSSAQLRDSQSRDTPTRVRHAAVLSPFDGNHAVSRGIEALDHAARPQSSSDKAFNRSGAPGALKSRSPVKINIPAAQSSDTQDVSDVLVLRQQLAALRKDVIVLQASMMVLTKRVGDNPESHIPTLETAVRRIQTAIESGEWTSFCAASSMNLQRLPEKTAAPARSSPHLLHAASTQQASLSKEVKAGLGLGAGMAAAAELEENRGRGAPATSLPHQRFSPSRSTESPKSVSISSNTAAEQLTEELDTVLIALRKAVELAEQSTDVIAAKYPDLRAIISQCHVLEEVPVALDYDGDDATKDLQRQCSECKAALKKVMSLLERQPGSDRLRDQVAKIRAKWMEK